ncbi:hypothetical protein SAMN05216303_102806 [Rhodoferax sp. OV413]|nr:hypothetical protein SAMN05216303_102806 [Rhodoferax sp. OV413]
MPEPRRGLTHSMQATILQTTRRLHTHPELAKLFQNCFPNTFQTTLEDLQDGRTFVVTGDIPAMWLRDSSAQVSPYVHLCAQDPVLAKLVAGVVRQQAHLISIDPYANAFNREEGHEYSFDLPQPDPWVWERKFELDSLCFPVWLAWRYVQATGDASALGDLRPMLNTILDTMETEQHHNERSDYTFQRPTEYCVLPSDTLPNEGRGAVCAPCGLVWSGFRPSDDACVYPYLIPANMFAVVALRHAADLARNVYGDERLATRAKTLESGIEEGLRQHAVVVHPEYGPIYTYETDGLGNHLLMDDANVPSLLSLPYLGYCRPDDELYLNTRRFVLSRQNPHYHEGSYAAGISSPHTPGRRVWPISLCIQALTVQQTAEGRKEAAELLQVLSQTTDGTSMMHESFDPENPAAFSRPWFAWANSLLAETVLHFLAQQSQMSGEETEILKGAAQKSKQPANAG